MKTSARIEQSETVVRHAPERKRPKHFTDFNIVVTAAPSRDPLSVPRRIDPEVTTFLDQHFYTSKRIRRMSTPEWHSQKRQHVGPSEAFVLEGI